MVTKGVHTTADDPAYQTTVARTREKAIRMRLQGRRWDEIAEECGYNSGGYAREMVSKVLKDSTESFEEAREEYRAVELARLNEMIRSHWAQAVSGENLKAAELVLKIIDRIARITGTEQPVKVDVTGGVTYEVVGWSPPGVLPAALEPGQ